MKTTIQKFNFLAIIMLFLAFGFANEATAQTTTWKYKAGDNSGGLVQLTTDGQGYVTKVNLASSGAKTWTATEIKEVDDYQEYIRVQSKGSGRVYEIHVYWESDKLIFVTPEAKEITYWLQN